MAGKERLRYYVKKWKPRMDRDIDPDGLIIELHQAKIRHYLDLMSGSLIPLRPGVERLLGEARAEGARLAIATTTSPENVTAFLRTLFARR